MPDLCPSVLLHGDCSMCPMWSAKHNIDQGIRNGVLDVVREVVRSCNCVAIINRASGKDLPLT